MMQRGNARLWRRVSNKIDVTQVSPRGEVLGLGAACVDELMLLTNPTVSRYRAS